MKFKCRPVNLDFFKDAPASFVNEVELDASAENVFAILEQAETWPLWFKEIIQVDWHTPYPYSVEPER